tara:strand:- start:1572 stop:1811 length:240 start_codon:yes stop_codon:yes gene_type:complete
MPIRNRIKVITIATPPNREEFLELMPWDAAESLPARRVDKANITTIAPRPVKPKLRSAKRAIAIYLVSVCLLGVLAEFL